MPISADAEWYLGLGSWAEWMRCLKPMRVLAGAVVSGISITVVKFQGCSEQQLELSLSGGFLLACPTLGFLTAFRCPSPVLVSR